MSGTYPIVDILVIGGGINGTGIAADAAGRNLKVLLCEQHDLASATSSNSSKLIHGGLRYLEHFEFRLVKESLAEREILIKNAPHIIHPLIFQLPHQSHLRPSWMIHLGLCLYDNLAKRVTLPPSRRIKFDYSSPLVNKITRGFEYSDAWVDDARLVLFNALAAKEHGAEIKTQTKCIKAIRNKKSWLVCLENTSTGEITTVEAKVIVNAAGPWVAGLFDKVIPTRSSQKIRLVKGSHIVVPRIHDQDHAFILQNPDQRIVFVLPFENDFSLIGTTDVEYEGEPSEVKISDNEMHYLLTITNDYFKKTITKTDIITTYSGVRPLLDDESCLTQAVTRDYTLELLHEKEKAPIISVFGGKITTYRKLAEVAVNRLSEFFSTMGPAWTANKALPGGEFSSKHELAQLLYTKYPWLTESLCARLVRTYGTYSEKLLGEANSLKDLGQHFGAELYAIEVDYQIQYEWATTVEDILWRRTKRGLYFTTEQVLTLKEYLDEAFST